MDSRRSLLVLALIFISFLVYQQWQLDKNPQVPTEQTTSMTANSDVPASSPSSNSQVVADSQTHGRIITLENDVFRLKVDTLGGDVISSELLKYDAELDSKTPFELLKDTKEHVYIAQSGLIGKNGIDTRSGRAQYQIEGDNFKLADGQESLSVPLLFEKDSQTYRRLKTIK